LEELVAIGGGDEPPGVPVEGREVRCDPGRKVTFVAAREPVLAVVHLGDFHVVPTPEPSRLV
jgi:hypothetical protein